MIQEQPLVLNLEQSEWDIASREDFANLLQPTYAYTTVVLDLTPVTFMDGRCFLELERLQAARAVRGFPPAQLVVVSPQVRRVFEITGFDEIWPLFDSLPAALAAA